MAAVGLSADITALLDEHTELVAAYLFGSEARGEAQVGSDIDLAVLFADDGPEDPYAAMGLRIAARLSARLGRDVDVVVVSSAPPALVHRVLRDGQLLVDRSPKTRLQFEVDSRNRYFDLQPIVRAYRAAAP